MEKVLIYLNFLLLLINVVVGFLNISLFFKNMKRNQLDAEQKIKLKELEIEEVQRKYQQDRESVFQELGGYVVERFGKSERFPSYEQNVQMDNYDVEHQAKTRKLYTELFHLQSVAGKFSGLLVGKIPWHKKLVMFIRSLFRF